MNRLRGWFEEFIWRNAKRVPPVVEVHGGNRTLSQEDQLKVEIDMDGNVFGVSFRGRLLPFYWTIDYGRRPDMVREQYRMTNMGSIDSIVFEAKDVAND